MLNMHCLCPTEGVKPIVCQPRSPLLVWNIFHLLLTTQIAHRANKGMRVSHVAKLKDVICGTIMTADGMTAELGSNGVRVQAGAGGVPRAAGSAGAAR